MTDSKNGRFNGVKVFSATHERERDELGGRVTTWLAANSRLKIVDKVVNQSSAEEADHRWHCLSIIIFYWEDLAPAAAAVASP